MPQTKRQWHLSLYHEAKYYHLVNLPLHFCWHPPVINHSWHSSPTCLNYLLHQSSFGKKKKNALESLSEFCNYWARKKPSYVINYIFNWQLYTEQACRSLFSWFAMPYFSCATKQHHLMGVGGGRKKRNLILSGTKIKCYFGSSSIMQCFVTPGGIEPGQETCRDHVTCM